MTISGDRPVTRLGTLATTFGLAKAEEKYRQQKATARRKEDAVKAATGQLGKAAAKFLNTYVERTSYWVNRRWLARSDIG